MQAIIDILLSQTFWAAIEAIAVVFTVWYGIRQFREMRRARQAQERPYVIVDFEVSDSFIEVVVWNIGGGAAKDVKFSFEPELITSDGRNLSTSFGLFKDGAGFLPSDKKISSFFDASAEYVSSGKPLAFDVNISYQDMWGNPWQTSMKLDLSMYMGRYHIRRKGVDEVAKALDKIEQHINTALAADRRP